MNILEINYELLLLTETVTFTGYVIILNHLSIVFLKTSFYMYIYADIDDMPIPTYL